MIKLILSSLLLTVAEATFSIVATDAVTMQVGGAGASCVPSADIFDVLYLSAPNISVLHTQGWKLERNSTIVTTAVDMMDTNQPIEDILGEMKELDTESFVGLFPLVELRQYGMADFSTNASTGGYTGQSLETMYDIMRIDNTEQIDIGMDRNDDGTDGRYSFHAQGNVVAEDTVQSLFDGFTGEGDGAKYQCDMADKLMAAMAKVVEEGLGDMRCINDHNGVTSTGAFLHIDNPDGTQLIHINIVGDGSYDPVEAIMQDFLKWRENNPCPVNSADDSIPDNEASSTPELSQLIVTKNLRRNQQDKSK